MASVTRGVLSVALLCAAGGAALAQDQSAAVPKDAIFARKILMDAISRNMDELEGMTSSGKAIDLAEGREPREARLECIRRGLAMASVEACGVEILEHESPLVLVGVPSVKGSDAAALVAARRECSIERELDVVRAPLAYTGHGLARVLPPGPGQPAHP